MWALPQATGQAARPEAPPLSQSTRTARSRASPGVCVPGGRRWAAPQGPFVCPAPPPPTPQLFPDRGQEQGRGSRASGLQGAPRGQAGPENKSCGVAFPCNVNPAGWGLEGPGPPWGRSDWGWGGGQPLPGDLVFGPSASCLSSRAGLSGGQLRRSGLPALSPEPGLPPLKPEAWARVSVSLTQPAMVSRCGRERVGA